jgi:peptide deformylase
MALLKIRVWPDPVLKKKGEKVTVFDENLRQLLEDMAETMYANKGIGLAGQQVGITKRILVCDVPLDEQENKTTGLMFLINPEIVGKNGKIVFKEGCLSFPGLEIEIERARNVWVKFQNVDGEEKELEASGLFAVCLQHEIDHLDGIVFVDRVGPVKRRLALREFQKLMKEQEEKRTLCPSD